MSTTTGTIPPPSDEITHVSFRSRVRRAFGATRAGLVIAAAALATAVSAAVLISVLNSAFGFIALENAVEPEELVGTGRTLEDLSATELVVILEDRLSSGLLRRLDSEVPIAERSAADLRDLVEERVIDPTVVDSWSLFESIFERELVEAFAEANPQMEIRFHSWISRQFLFSQQSTDPLDAGILSAIIGTLMVVGIALLLAVPIGISTGIYFSEYARKSRLNAFLQLNVQNLAAVPSVIYGLLGLAIFVRFGAPLTTGAMFGSAGASDGRTVLAAGLTLGVLVLPVVVINAESVFSSIPDEFRSACQAVGASRSQIVFFRLLPFVLDRILTIAILAVSRVIGETTPLIIVGAATVMAVNPSGLFSRFTALPSQIYYWSFNPQEEFQRLAAAAILILLVLSLGLNILLVVLRRRIQIRKG